MKRLEGLSVSLARSLLLAFRLGSELALRRLLTLGILKSRGVRFLEGGVRHLPSFTRELRSRG